MSTAKKAAKAAMIIMAATLFSKILGFGRETLLASKFGATVETDSFLVAIMIPTILFVSLSGALNTAIIPVFTEYRVKGQKEEAKQVASALFTIVLWLGVLVSVLGIIFAPTLVHLIAPKFRGEAFSLTVVVTRLVFPMTIFVGLASLLAGILQSHEKFTMPAFNPIPYNIIIIGYLMFLPKVFGIHGLAIAFLLGMAGQFFVQLPAYLKMDYGLGLTRQLNLPGTKKIGVLFLPVFFSTAAGQINFFVDRILASGLIAGSISALNFANKLNIFAFGIFTAAITTVIFPTLSKYSAQDEPCRFKNVVSLGLRMTAFILLPISAGMIVLRYPIIMVLFERGAFDRQATDMTTVALLFFSLGLVTLGMREVLTRAFFSLQDSKTPMVNGFIAVGVNVVSNIILVNYMTGNENVLFGTPLKNIAHGGLAFGTSFASLVSFIFLLFLLRKRLGGFGDRAMFASFVKMGLATLIMGITCSLAYYKIFPHFVDLSGKIQFFTLFGLISLGAVVYAATNLLLKSRELLYLWEVIVKKSRLARPVSDKGI